MSACASASGMYFVMLPPTSCERESLPSENAPAPAQPLMMAQGLQPTHFPVIRAGHLRSAMARPLSISNTFFVSSCFISSSAVKMPAGPAPMMTASYVLFMAASSCFRLAHLSPNYNISEQAKSKAFRTSFNKRIVYGNITMCCRQRFMAASPKALCRALLQGM